LTLRSLAVVLVELDVGVVIVARPDGSAGVVSARDLLAVLVDHARAMSSPTLTDGTAGIHEMRLHEA
jgi:hypothetical protein